MHGRTAAAKNDRHPGKTFPHKAGKGDALYTRQFLIRNDESRMHPLLEQGQRRFRISGGDDGKPHLVQQLFKKIEKHGKCMLGYCFGGISGNIAPGNAARSQIVFIQIIGSGSSNTDKLQMRCGMDCLFVNRNFIDNQNVCVLDPFRCFFRLFLRLKIQFS